MELMEMKNVLALFRNLRLALKLSGAFALVVSVSCVMSYAGYQGATRMALFNSAAQSLFVHDLSGISSIKEAAIFQVKATRELRDILLATGDKDSISDMGETLNEFDASVKDNLDTANANFEDPTSKQKVEDVRKDLPLFKADSAQLIEAAQQGDLAAAKSALKEASMVANRINLAIAETCRIREDAAKNSRLEAQTTYRKLRVTLFSLALGVAVLGVVCGILTTRSVTRPLKEMMEVLKAAADGDLTQRLDSIRQDELGQMAGALDQALESTRGALLEVDGMTGAMVAASQELTLAAGVLERGSKDQASGLAATSATLEQITTTARRTAQHARHATQLASGPPAENGNAAEARTAGKSEDISAVAAMSEINRASTKIATILSVVDSIAFQTGLLALNAAVEAAHAGDEGRGFAVVASEVRNLAKRSSDSASEIRGLIEDSIHKVGTGSQLVGRVTQLIGEIATASAEQSVGIEQVGQSIMAMDKITQGNSIQAERLTATARSLSNEAVQLRQTIARFQLVEPSSIALDVR